MILNCVKNNILPPNTEDTLRADLMKINVVIPLDEKGRKKVDQYRFQYDRRLMKLCEPAIEIFQSVESYVNLRTVRKEISEVINGLKRFKVEIEGVGSSFPDYPSLYFTTEENKHIKALKHKLGKISIFKEIHDEDYTPNIPFYQLNDEEEAGSISEEVSEDPLTHHFFANCITLIMKDKTEEWEIIDEYHF